MRLLFPSGLSDPGAISEPPLGHMLLSQISCANQHTAGHAMGESNRRSDKKQSLSRSTPTSCLIGQLSPTEVKGLAQGYTLKY